MAPSHSTSQPDLIRRLMDEQMDLAGHLREVLKQEYAILSQATPEGLDALLPEKQSALERLLQADTALHDVLKQHGLDGDAKDIEQLMRLLDPAGGLAASWRRLADVLNECETQNQTNGSLVEMSRQQVELALNVLRGETPATSTYGSNGQTQRSARSRSIAEA